MTIAIFNNYEIMLDSNYRVKRSKPCKYGCCISVRKIGERRIAQRFAFVPAPNQYPYFVALRKAVNYCDS